MPRRDPQRPSTWIPYRKGLCEGCWGGCCTLPVEVSASDLIRLALASTADLAITPLQDVMRLGDEARMNTPGKPFGNWGWRYLPHMLHPGLASDLAELTTIYGRCLEESEPEGYDPFDYMAPGTEHPLREKRK